MAGEPLEFCGYELSVSAQGAPPVKGTSSGPAGSLLVSSSVALRVPVAVGLKLTLSVHVAPGATAAPRQPSLGTTKSDGSGPMSCALVTLSGPSPVLVMVRVCGALVVPTARGAKPVRDDWLALA